MPGQAAPPPSTLPGTCGQKPPSAPPSAARSLVRPRASLYKLIEKIGHPKQKESANRGRRAERAYMFSDVASPSPPTREERVGERRLRASSHDAPLPNPPHRR